MVDLVQKLGFDFFSVNQTQKQLKDYQSSLQISAEGDIEWYQPR
jgi:hypothetical protein